MGGFITRRLTPFPDREQRHLLQFYVAPRLGYGVRLACAGILILSGLMIQLAWHPEKMIVVLMVTLPLLLVGVLLVLNRGFDTTPSRADGAGDWEKTTLDRFEQIRVLEDRTRRWDETVVDLTCVMGFFSFLGVIVVTALVAVMLAASAATRSWAAVFAADVVVLLVPLWVTGTRRGWRPQTLRQQVESLQVALDEIETFQNPSCQVQPMLEMIGEGQRRVPVGARVLIRFPDGPEQFYGLQLQVTLNDVAGTHYPYLYAVLVAQSAFSLISGHLEVVQRRCPPKIVVEASRESDVEVIVIRQHTTKRSGYHTKPADIRRIAAFAWERAAAVVQ